MVCGRPGLSEKGNKNVSEHGKPVYENQKKKNQVTGISFYTIGPPYKFCDKIVIKLSRLLFVLKV
jgi:hypothetical protein